MAQWPPLSDTLPADSPVLTLEIQFDDYPQDVIYILKADDVDEGVAVSRAASKQSVIAFGPQEPFPNSLRGESTTIEIKIPQIAPGTSRDFTFMFIDSQNDGLCCDYGSGSYTLYYGPKSNNQVVASGTAENSGRVIHGFVLSDSGVISVTSPNSGSRSGTAWPVSLFTSVATVLWFLC